MSGRETNSSFLKNRIQLNEESQQVDFNSWIFDNIAVGAEDRVLELCCGTGKQSLVLADKTRERGTLLCVDKSQQSLEVISESLRGKGYSHVTVQPLDLDEMANFFNEQYDHCFDLIFCSYGLYYAQNILSVLETVRRLLSKRGRFVVVGPYGPNNAPLFALLRGAGVTINDFVMYTSADFMTKTVLPWAVDLFGKVCCSTVVNRVTWKSKKDILDYWKSSTFYDSSLESAVDESLSKHFAQQDVFVNEKLVMAMEAGGLRK